MSRASPGGGSEPTGRTGHSSAPQRHLNPEGSVDPQGSPVAEAACTCHPRGCPWCVCGIPPAGGAPRHACTRSPTSELGCACTGVRRLPLLGVSERVCALGGDRDRHATRSRGPEKLAGSDGVRAQLHGGDPSRIQGQSLLCEPGGLTCLAQRLEPRGLPRGALWAGTGGLRGPGSGVRAGLGPRVAGGPQDWDNLARPGVEPHPAELGSPGRGARLSHSLPRAAASHRWGFISCLSQCPYHSPWL